MAIPVAYIPTSDNTVDVEMSDGTFDTDVRHYWELSAEDTIKVQGVNSFEATERLNKKAQNDTYFSYNYDKMNYLTVTGLAMTYKGKTIYPKNADNMVVSGSREVVESYGHPFYELSATNYELKYGELVLASARQMFLVDEEYVPSWICNQWYAKHNAFVREATRSNNVVSVRCNNTATFWQLFDDQSHRDSLDVDYTVLNKFNMTIPEMEVEDKTALYNKSFAFVADTAMVQGNKVKAEWQSATIENNIPYNGINYKDSIAPCVAVAKNLVFNADATAITVYFFNKDHENSEDYAIVTMPVKVSETVKFKELVKTFVHNAFRSTATVSGSNIAVLCDNTASFQKTYTNGSKDKAESVKYVVTNNFTYNMPANMPSEAKGNTYSFNGSTATVVSKNVTVSFSSRTIADIMFEKVNYKDDKKVPQCEVAVKSIKFGETKATITFSHDKETVTAEVPVTYNSVEGYERVGNPIHDSWNSAYNTSNGFGITCSNHVVVREVMTDGTKGSSFDLPYKSTNTWVVSGKTTFVVESLSSVLNVREDIVNGSASIDGNVINFVHSMSAEKVSKGAFSYQPAACEAVAKYITVISATQARVDIYHDNTKIGEYILPVNITEEPQGETIDGKIIAGWATDSYETSSDFHYNWHASTFHILVLKNGSYTVYSRDVNATSGWKTTSVSSSLATNGKALAYVGASGEAAIGYIDQSVSQGSWYKIVYRDANGNLDKVLSDTEHTMHKNDNLFQRNPVRGTWSNGVITADGHTLKVTGTQN